MRNGTNKRTPLIWAQILALALIVALVSVGCAGKGARPDEGGAVSEPVEATEEQADQTEPEDTTDVPEAETMTDAAEAEEDTAEVEAAPVTEEAEDDVEADEVDVEDAYDPARSAPSGASADDLVLPEDGTYTSKDEVAWYLHTYGHLPSNYVTKRESQDAGWKTRNMTVAEAVPGKSIGGDRFGNYEGLLPDKKGRVWYECDIDFHGEKKRNSKRIVYSNDGLIYYTDDHFSSFERIY